MSTSTDFTGSIPALYDRFLGPVVFEPYAVELVGRLAAAEARRTLELACGTGIVTRRLRAALPASATLVASDLHAAMVDYAQAAVGAPGIEWRVADAQALPFAAGAFDAVVCQFGLMFLPDKVRGLTEARRVLRAGGTLLASVWLGMDANPYARAMHTRLATLFPDNPPRFFETPHGYADADRLRADLAATGWHSLTLDDVRLQSQTTALALANGFARGTPLTHELVQRHADLDYVVAQLAQAVNPAGGDQPFAAQLGATVIHAVR